jgi:hypothetical protein
LSKLTQAKDEGRLAYDELLEGDSSSLVAVEEATAHFLRRAAHTKRLRPRLGGLLRTALSLQDKRSSVFVAEMSVKHFKRKLQKRLKRT